MAAHISADGEGLTRSAQSAAQSAMRGRLGRQHYVGWQRTITKVGKSDCEGTAARGKSTPSRNGSLPRAADPRIALGKVCNSTTSVVSLPRVFGTSAPIQSSIFSIPPQPRYNEVARPAYVPVSWSMIGATSVRA
jgi:hypothetical protein